MAQGFPWGFALPPCRTQAWQLLGNSIPPPIAYLGLLKPAAALQSLDEENTAEAGRPRHSSGAAMPEMGLGTPHQGAPARFPGDVARGCREPPRPRQRAQGVGSLFNMQSPGRQTPQVAMIQGRRATEEEVATTVWLNPPTPEETQDLLVVLLAIRHGAFAVKNLPGAGHPESLWAKGLHQPPRQGCVTPSLVAGICRRG